MLFTTCPTCAATFKVLPDQLNIRQGRVMCGRCRGVFNAFESLKRMSESERESAVAPEPAPAPAPTPTAAAQTAEPSNVPAKLPAAPAEIMPVVAVEPAAPAATPPPLAFDLRTGAPANNALIAPRKPAYAPAKPRVAPWVFGAVLLTASLALMAAYAFRNELAQQYPQLQPSFTAACGYVGCTISWGRDADAITVEASDMISPPDKPNRILLTAQLQNRARVKQDYPVIELRLMDSANQIVVRRLLAPADYLGRALLFDEAMAPGADVFLSLTVDTAGIVPPSGYGLRVFYPPN